MTDETTIIEKIESRSSFYEKTDAAFRRQINRAVVDRDPPTYRALFQKFRLADRGISYHAFYRHARRLRIQAAALDVADAVLPDNTDLAGLLPHLVACRLLDALQDESTAPTVLQQLTDTWRIAAKTSLVMQQYAAEADAARKKAGKKDLDELCGLVKQYGRLVKHDTRNQLRHSLHAEEEAVRNLHPDRTKP
ncbi:MAG: hypothetical protein ACE5F9_14315 [Phycisphaerae bacterium]